MIPSTSADWSTEPSCFDERVKIETRVNSDSPTCSPSHLQLSTSDSRRVRHSPRVRYIPFHNDDANGGLASQNLDPFVRGICHGRSQPFFRGSYADFLQLIYILSSIITKILELALLPMMDPPAGRKRSSPHPHPFISAG